jgi:hypothetical protein
MTKLDICKTNFEMQTVISYIHVLQAEALNVTESVLDLGYLETFD